MQVTKSEFLTPFEAVLLDERTREGRRLWRVDEPLQYFSASLGVVITVPVGFITDLNSTPRLPLVYWMVGDVADEAACLHDYTYSLKLFPRETCDNLLKEAALATNTPPWQAALLWAGVRVGGASHYDP
jgi:hypothetical protein